MEFGVTLWTSIDWRRTDYERAKPCGLRLLRVALTLSGCGDAEELTVDTLATRDVLRVVRTRRMLWFGMGGWRKIVRAHSPR